MRHSMRTAERAFFAEPEWGTCSPIGSPTFSHSSSPSTPSSLSDSTPGQAPQLSIASQVPRQIPTNPPQPQGTLRHTGSPPSSTERVSYSELGQGPRLIFPAGFLPPPPNQSARRVAQGFHLRKWYVLSMRIEDAANRQTKERERDPALAQRTRAQGRTGVTRQELPYPPLIQPAGPWSACGSAALS
ncbi:hypothetical protein CALVIDRAFT_37029 [Calocera viscosa TUFC12733]|uniref:Uncharacterized protein n=1 Tax=Calocera viscosa (strain TUFC12733) TaxID=1330018 RepID=A0A167NYZ8_CALVF|nr:hypothetical protein CALVIDRAFT_37029 [Calocera viscosa TUFC12733]